MNQNPGTRPVPSNSSQRAVSPTNSVPSSPPPVYIGIQSAAPASPTAPAGIGDRSLLQPPPLKPALFGTNPLTSTTLPDDPTLPRVDHMEYRLSSFDRSQEDAAFKVQELAEILDSELQDYTYDDPNVFKKLFPEKEFNVEKKELLQKMKPSEAYMPDFIKCLEPNKRTGKAAVVLEEEEDDDSDRISDEDYVEGYVPKKKGLSDEDKLVAWFGTIKIDMNSIVKVSATNELPNTLKVEESVRAFDSDSSTIPLIAETKEKRKPDLILLAKEKIVKGTRGRWPFALLAVELTRKDKFPAKLLRQMAQRGALMLHNSPGRRFAPVMGISGAQFIVCVYHRSGVNCSPRYNIFENRYMFYSFIAEFYFCKRYRLGFDPNIKLNKHFLPRTVNFKGVEFKILKKLDVREGIQGRGTVCWIVQNMITQKLYTMKLSWIEITIWADIGEHETEVVYYESMKKKGTKGVPRMVGHEDTKINNVLETTGIWRPNTLKPGQVFRERTYRKILLDGIGRPLTYFRSLKELLSATIDLCKNHGGLYFEANILHMDMSLRNMLLIDAYPTAQKNAASNPFGASPAARSTTSARTGRPVPVSQATVSPNSENTSGSITAATDSEAKGVSTEDTSFLHDADSQEDDKIVTAYRFARGLIVDFDFAVFVKLQLELEEILKHTSVNARNIPSLVNAHERRLKMRTGTLPYMAIQVLLGCDTTGKPFPHTYQNDVESIIYGLMKMCIYQAGPNNTKRDFKKDPIPSVYSGTKRLPTDFWVMKKMTWAELGFMKTMTWTNLNDYVIPCMHSYFKDLGPMFLELRDAFFPNTMSQADYDRRINSKVQYATILRILRKYRDLLSDEAPLNPRPDPYPDYPGSDSNEDEEEEDYEPRRSGRVAAQPQVNYNMDVDVDDDMDVDSE